MQPYFFPYIGYFRLINSVDKFIFLDDVNFINKGWINRNRIILNGDESFITIPLQYASQNKKILEILINKDKKFFDKNRKSIVQSYKKSKYFNIVFPLIEDVLFGNFNGIGEMAKSSVIKICNYLSIKREIVKSTSYFKNDYLKGQDRIIDICSREGALEYWNLPGGKDLYDEKMFNKNNIKLKFINNKFMGYENFSKFSNYNLSIIDMLMHVSREDIIKNYL